jgi:hypothetical protein
MVCSHHDSRVVAVGPDGRTSPNARPPTRLRRNQAFRSHCETRWFDLAGAGACMSACATNHVNVIY